VTVSGSGAEIFDGLRDIEAVPQRQSCQRLRHGWQSSLGPIESRVIRKLNNRRTRGDVSLARVLLGKGVKRHEEGDMNTLIKRQTFRVDDEGNLVELPPDTRWREALARDEIRAPEPQLYTGLYL